MAQFKAVGGFWVAVNVDAISDGQAFLHVAVSVTGFDQFAVEELQVTARAGDQELALTGAPNGLIHLQTRAITAVAPFTFADPDRLAVTSVSVTLRGETETWDTSTEDPGPPLVA